MRRDQQPPLEREIEAWAAHRNNKYRRAKERSKKQAKRERREDREYEDEHD